MEIKDFKIGEKYRREDLISAFKGAFQGGINICKRTNTIVITSKHTGNRIYDDKLFDGDIMYYVGEGQKGDQKMWKGNKAILEAKDKKRDIHLFVRFKETEYTYFGIVVLVDEPFFANGLDVQGNMRKVIKFPIMRTTSTRRLTDYEMSRIAPGGVAPMAKPIIQVVGAAIINEKGQVLCAQRGHGSLIGKWEFPGGKIEQGETDQEALKREIKEELDIDIEVQELIEENYYEYKESNINLKVYKCRYISGRINDTEHQSLKWVENKKLGELDWADADKPIVDAYIDALPRSIEGQINFDYFEAEAVKTSDRELLRAVQDYERSQRNQRKAGESAETAVLSYEKDKLNNIGRPDLADMVRQVSHLSSDYGYDILSFEINSGVAQEVHIEVKSAKLTNSYIEFFISQNELDKFRNDPVYKVYCLIRVGRNYKLHEISKTDFFAHDYLSPMSYRVRIRIAE